MCLEIKFTLNFCCTIADARPVDLIFANARKAKFYFVEFAGIQKCQCACRLFRHFSMLALTLIICSFALMQKNQNQGFDAFAKTDCATLKCKTRFAQTVYIFNASLRPFLNAHSSMPECVLQTEFYLT